jgi:hypothetical protein
VMIGSCNRSQHMKSIQKQNKPIERVSIEPNRQPDAPHLRGASAFCLPSAGFIRRSDIMYTARP